MHPSYNKERKLQSIFVVKRKPRISSFSLSRCDFLVPVVNCWLQCPMIFLLVCESWKFVLSHIKTTQITGIIHQSWEWKINANRTVMVCYNYVATVSTKKIKSTLYTTNLVEFTLQTKISLIKINIRKARNLLI